MRRFDSAVTIFSPLTLTLTRGPVPTQGTYRESIDANPTGVSPLTIIIQHDGDFRQILVPSNYGYVYLGP